MFSHGGIQAYLGDIAVLFQTSTVKPSCHLFAGLAFSLFKIGICAVQ